MAGFLWDRPRSGTSAVVESAAREQAARAARRELLHFLLPGIVHALNNDLFAIRGYGQVLGLDAAEISRERGAILRASESAAGAVDLLRVLGSDVAGVPGAGSVPSTIEQPGVLLPKLRDLLRAPLRDRGATVSSRHASVETPGAVDTACFALCVCETGRCLADALPTGFHGTVELDLATQNAKSVAVEVRVTPSADQLPFPIDLHGVVARATALLDSLGARVVANTEVSWVRVEVPSAEEAERRCSWGRCAGQRVGPAW